MAKKKVRVEFRKNRSKPPRSNTWTSEFREHGYEEQATLGDERVRARGDLSRARTIITDDAPAEPGNSPTDQMPSVTTTDLLFGRVIKVLGLHNVVETASGEQYKCAIRRLLKNLHTSERSVVTTGDLVWFKPEANFEGMIMRVEPRHGNLTRASRKKEHVLVANVDQVVIVVSLVEPELKPHLIDRYIAVAMKGDLKPIICLNKADLVEHGNLQPLIGYYNQIGIPTLLTSASSGYGISNLRELLAGKASVFSGQSGVGKSSLLNAVQPGLSLRVRNVSEVNNKGRHTTTTAELIRLEGGGYLVDTPGVRQLELWDTIPEEVEMYFVEFRPFITMCAYPDCSHTHESKCAVKQAVERRLISARRYHSYLGMIKIDKRN